jgi:hypothetical protein
VATRSAWAFSSASNVSSGRHPGRRHRTRSPHHDAHDHRPLGRDINVDNPSVTALALLRDLGSTNGTWIELDRVEQHELANQQEFRIGSHVLMFIVTDVE